MTTELTLREKAIDAAWRDVKRELAKMMSAKPMPGVPTDDWSARGGGEIDLALLCGVAFDSLAETLDATGAPRVHPGCG